MSAPILLDIARLLGRAGHTTPSGIDRVELAYAQHLAARVPERLRYVVMDGMGRLCELPGPAAQRFIAALGRHWAGEDQVHGLAAMARLLWIQAILLQPIGAGRGRWRQPLYLLVSHKHLHRRNRVEAAISRAGALLAVFVHDLIPIAFPEFARPGQTALHQDRMQTVAALADAVVVNSRCTAASLAPYLAGAGRAMPVLVAPLGTGLPDVASVPGEPPYFIAIGTIEPRKNHLLLLQVWRLLADRLGPAAPRLVLIGRRGWENENVIDHLDRSPAIRALVTEHAGLPDRHAAALLRGSRALLLPSFAEGYGLPLAEALAARIPAVCSDLPALREVGGDVPDYLQPLDGLGWAQAVLDYIQPDSPRRAAQLRRMARWRAPCWAGHVEAVLEMLGRLQPAQAAAPRRAWWSGATAPGLDRGMAR